jgi:hypothetical protein
VKEFEVQTRNALDLDWRFKFENYIENLPFE